MNIKNYRIYGASEIYKIIGVLMQKIINIGSNTSVDLISESWGADDYDELVFVISKTSSFALFAEGVALGYLQAFLLSEKRLFVQFHKSSKKISLSSVMKSSGNSYLDITNLNIPEILCGIFGLQLIYKSSGIFEAFSDIDDPVKARRYLGSFIWKVVQSNKGQLGDGKSQYLISRHDYRMPAVFRGRDALSFPASDVFRSKISSIIGSIGDEKVSSVDAKTMVGSWIYHIAENAFEHGSVDENENLINGYSGILIQKIATPNEAAIEKREDLDGTSKEYIRDLYRKHGFKNTNTLTVVTVMDCGLGIHNTLPDKYKSYSDEERLDYAFKRGVTRQKIGEGRSGYGLFDSIRAARKLNALLVVCSANIYAVKSFEELGGDDISFLRNVIHLGKLTGSSQSIIWPSKSN